MVQLVMWVIGSPARAATVTACLPSLFIRVPYTSSVLCRGQNVGGCHMVPTFLILWDPGSLPSPDFSRSCFYLTEPFIHTHELVVGLVECGVECGSCFSPSLCVGEFYQIFLYFDLFEAVSIIFDFSASRNQSIIS